MHRVQASGAADGVTTCITGHGSSTMDVYTCCWGHNNLSHGTVGGSAGIGVTVYTFDPTKPKERHFYSVSGSSSCRRAGTMW